MNVSDLMKRMLDRANASKLNELRLKDWDQIVKWDVDGEAFLWTSKDGKFVPVDEGEAGFTMQLSAETLKSIVNKDIPFFMAIWGTGDIQFTGSFGDAYRLGYVFLDDLRERKVIFVSHCWLNINTRFPQGAAFSGANTPLIKTLLDSGLGIIQMPCPEYHALGLEKYDYGKIILEPLRERFLQNTSIL